MVIKQFLKLRANRSWDISDILHQIALIMQSEGSVFFVSDDTEKFICLSLIALTKNNDKIKLEKDFCLNNFPTEIQIITDTEKIPEIITTKIKLNTLLLIPICHSCDEVIAYIGLWNSPEFHLDQVDMILEYITLLEIFAQKEKLLLEFQKLESNGINGITKTLFLANISHEIRTPLNGIVGYSQLLTQTQLNETQQAYILSLNKCSTQLLQIMNDILDFSKLSSNKMTVNEEYFDVKTIVETVRDTLATKIFEKKQNMEIILHPTVPKYIISDKNKIIQILINLVSNANKFAKNNGLIQIDLQCKESCILEVSVRDNGIGISDTDQCKLFCSFVQLENSKYKTGTGLGLYICKKLSELLGGNISVKSILGKGSTFTFTIRFKEYKNLKLKNEVIEDLYIFKDKYILIVDDNADNRIVISNYLTDVGCIPIICETALEALRIVMSNRYPLDLGLIDIHMPGVSGDELAKLLKEDFPFFKLIALSSYDSVLNSSLFEYKIDKPIDKILLYNVIFQALRKDESEKEKPKTRLNLNSKDNFKFLIAEDIQYNANVLVSMLESIGYNHTQIFSDGCEVIEYFENRPPTSKTEILLLDLIMPLKDGYDVLTYMKKNGIDIPVIVITASVLDNSRKRCSNFGVKYFINKPIKLEQLRQDLALITMI